MQWEGGAEVAFERGRDGVRAPGGRSIMVSYERFELRGFCAGRTPSGNSVLGNRLDGGGAWLDVRGELTLYVYMRGPIALDMGSGSLATAV